jgi:hypothetical protein
MLVDFVLILDKGQSVCRLFLNTWVFLALQNVLHKIMEMAHKKKKSDS